VRRFGTADCQATGQDTTGRNKTCTTSHGASVPVLTQIASRNLLPGGAEYGVWKGMRSDGACSIGPFCPLPEQTIQRHVSCVAESLIVEMNAREILDFATSANRART
jgi:hypothetical protein